MEDGSRVRVPLQSSSQGGEESMKVFREGIDLALNFCRAFQFYVRLGYFGSNPSLRIHNFCDNIFSCFIQSKDPPTKIELMRQLNPLQHLPGSLEKSIEEILKEANAHRLMWKQVNKFELENPFYEEIRKANLILYDTMWRKKDRRREVAALKNEENAANLTEVDGFRVLQADLINLKANSSKIDGSRVLQGDSMRVFKEGVAKKLIVMYEECLQGNFSSVEILREENQSWESSSDETIVTHRPGYGTHTRWENPYFRSYEMHDVGMAQWQSNNKGKRWPRYPKHF
ncbi:hypothetical protein TSUD_362390 [Trifolium subterraneum]|uniref:Uncharacterized protein n=1 Tax=Trifolium subterraneum TaxID=3900 RepID=A0A2Z6NYI5_TRISU|nr:hypothetical protein TSUD_362390 [Trifolium subterraneum]